MPTVLKSAQSEASRPDPAKSKAPKGGSNEINPIPVVVAAVVLAGALCWFLWLGPKLAADKAASNWATPEAAAARSPENKPKNAAHESLVQQLREKEGGGGGRARSRRDE